MAAASRPPKVLWLATWKAPLLDRHRVMLRLLLASWRRSRRAEGCCNRFRHQTESLAVSGKTGGHLFRCQTKLGGLVAMKTVLFPRLICQNDSHPAFGFFREFPMEMTIDLPHNSN